MNVVISDQGSYYCQIQGNAEGTSYSIIYQDDQTEDVKPAVDELLMRFEQSLSVYDETSIISRFNKNEEVVLDDFFLHVFSQSKKINEVTNGAFDASAEPLFRAWGFSSGERRSLSEEDLAELKGYIGMDKVVLKDGKLLSKHPQTTLNFNAIAKGYSADIIADLLNKKGYDNYLVEIGGEICLKGFNTHGEPWRIGIDRPAEDNPIPGQDLEVVLQLTDRCIATSGNYRQFYVENGQKIVHTIDPRSGYPVKHNLLSATVFAESALVADAFATAFLVVGVKQALAWINEIPNMDAIFICDENGAFKVYCTEGVEDKIIEI